MVGNDRILDKETGEYREIGYGDIVILLRSATGWSETFSQVLSSRGIPVVFGIQNGIFFRAGSGDASELSASLRQSASGYPADRRSAFPDRRM